jgi:hypothetical protein
MEAGSTSTTVIQLDYFLPEKAQTFGVGPDLPLLSSIDWRAALLSIAAMIARLRFKTGMGFDADRLRACGDWCSSNRSCDRRRRYLAYL